MDPLIDIEHVFLHKTTRKVHKDSIVSIDGNAFEAPSILIGKTVNIAFNPRPPILKIEVSYNGKNYGEAKPVDLYANTKIKRNHNLNGELEIISAENKSQKSGALL